MISNKKLDISNRLAIVVFASSAVMGLLLCMLLIGQNSDVLPSSSLLQNVEATGSLGVSDQNYSLPVRLTIPKIGVDASIVYMGLDATGNMEAPTTNQDAGWYKYGPRPGNAGSAVLAGHLGVGSRAVFTQLHLLEKGDTLSVTDDRGRVVSFVVTDMREYDYVSEPAEVFSSSAGVHLNLITCNGDWDPTQKTYSKRLVVFTDMMDNQGVVGVAAGAK